MQFRRSQSPPRSPDRCCTWLASKAAASICSGNRSRGKTTCLQAAASVWGRGATPGYVRAWRATANGLEGAAAQSTDTVMVLDELGMVDARDAAQALYGLANGAGQATGGRDGSPREPKSWRVLFFSSGELPVDAKLSETPGRKARAGQLVRLLDVPAERGMGFGVFDNGGPDGDAAALAKSIKLAATVGLRNGRPGIRAATDCRRRDWR